MALTAVNAVGVRAGKWTNNTLMAAKVTGMMALVALAFARGSTPASDVRVAGDRCSAGSRSLQPDADRARADPVRLWRLAELREPRGGNQEPGAQPRRAPTSSASSLVVVLYLSLNLAYLWVLTPRAGGGVAGARGGHGPRGGRRGGRAVRRDC